MDMDNRYDNRDNFFVMIGGGYKGCWRSGGMKVGIRKF